MVLICFSLAISFDYYLDYYLSSLTKPKVDAKILVGGNDLLIS